MASLEELAPVLGVRAACEAMGVPRDTLVRERHRRHRQCLVGQGHTGLRGDGKRNGVVGAVHVSDQLPRQCVLRIVRLTALFHCASWLAFQCEELRGQRAFAHHLTVLQGACHALEVDSGIDRCIRLVGTRGQRSHADEHGQQQSVLHSNSLSMAIPADDLRADRGYQCVSCSSNHSQAGKVSSDSRMP